jgi:transcriptional regulator with XRE-family HTH domain
MVRYRKGGDNIMENDISKRIKQLRLEKGMTLEEVATIVGVGKSTVRKWETGMITNMKRDKIPLLAKALSTTPEFLMGWERPEPIIEKPLTKGEKALLDLFRKVPEDKQQLVIQMIRVALNTKG